MGGCFSEKKNGAKRTLLRHSGAAGRSRTGTRSPSTDFESVASANFTTAAFLIIQRRLLYHKCKPLIGLLHTSTINTFVKSIFCFSSSSGIYYTIVSVKKQVLFTKKLNFFIRKPKQHCPNNFFVSETSPPLFGYLRVSDAYHRQHSSQHIPKPT